MSGLLFLAAVLAGCTDRTADLQQQITSLHNELDQAKVELDTAHRQLAEMPAAGGVGTPATGAAEPPSRGNVEHSYEEAARVFRASLETQLAEAQLGNFTLYRPEVEQFPYRSEFSMEVRLRGKPLQIDRIPVKAGLDGKWMFPTVAEVSDLIERIKTSPPGALPPATPAAAPMADLPRAAARADAGVTAPAAANQTVIVDWGDAPGRPAPPPRAGTVNAAPAPAATREPAAPVKVMPTARDVQIRF